ncbi:bromodomain and PHD finger-containing protein 3 [Lentinula aciculospora]|uniref:Bromodomain and PHD finger-containing protein 3 n=1 Tax=Lentinula aciculospora TaxID=153920 RepID=A0A9W9DL98_9AGAR|nr:bromodomain and PHD finger-containing protein 3 [Lentinula aciculospora]
MARGIRASSSTAIATSELPKVSFQKIDDDLTLPTTGVDDRQARSYGYNDFSDFERPEHYIRHIEPLETDLARQVEYDMDEQDKEWLDNLNAERRKEQMDKISYETFEIIMDRLEKEWFDLTKNIPKADFAMPSEDSTCAICDDSEGENSNAIVFCDGCNLAVHQDCYGVPYIPEGQWLCRKCTVSPENPVSCILCPNEGGAFKQTINGEWVHLLCAIWVPETRVANEVFMEPVVGVDKISKQRWKLKCSICDIREGACIQCAKTSCFLAFHTTCARNEKLLLPMKSTQAENVTLTCYCDKHLPKEQQEAREAALAAEAEEDDVDGKNHLSKTSKSARAYAKTYKPGPPLVPAIIVDRITQYISKVSLRKRSDFLLMVCKYWSLKREARRGAPLLKRLHLEPWTAAAAAGNAKLKSEEERVLKLEQLRLLEQDLQKLRELSAFTWKRESRKLQQMEIIQVVLTQALFPHEPRLRSAFERIAGYDKNNYFKTPVSKVDVPDYFDVITQPMCWSIIDAKLDRHEYWDIKDFRNDIELVLQNATTYNKAGTPFYKAAQRIKISARPVLQELERVYTRQPLPTPDKPLDETAATVKTENENIVSSSFPSVIGDLEPPLELVELLLSLEAIKDESQLILTANPISSLINIELPVLKPPPPPPPPKPRKAPVKAPKAPKLKLPKPDRSEEYKRYKAKKAEERAHRAEVEAAMAAAGLADERLVIRTRRSTAAAATAATISIADPAAGPSSSRLPIESPSVPEFRDHVDNQASFKLFNSGWILPSDQKRRTRAPTVPPSLSLPIPGSGIDRSALPPPRKKMRLDRETSKLSVFSTAEEENQTLNPGNAIALFDISRASSSAPRSTRKLMIEPSGLPRIGDVIHAANGKIIIEELDSPATRREKHMRRKAEKDKLKYTILEEPMTTTIITASADIPSTSAVMLDSDVGTSTPPPSSDHSAEMEMEMEPKLEPGYESYSKVLKGKGKQRIEVDSELSSLSEGGEEDVAAVATAFTKALTPPPPLVSPVLTSKLEGGTLVWAKADTFPWWPAVVFEIDDPAVPAAAKKMYTNMKRRNKNLTLHFVRFYDKQHSWQCLGIEKLLPLGDDDELDADLVANQSKRQKWKNSKLKAECREAFRCVEMLSVRYCWLTCGIERQNRI